jgi:septal ring factor EnvC (AmiA/AmiB activator)
MSEPQPTVEERVAALEVANERVERHSLMNRQLITEIDREAGETRAILRSQTRLLTALRETQAEHSVTLVQHGVMLGGLATAVESLAAGQQALAAGQKSLAAGQKSLTAGQAELRAIVDGHTETLDRHTELLEQIAEAVLPGRS